MPWDHIDCGVTGGFLREEAEKSLSGVLTADCRVALCNDCGVCDEADICIVSAGAESAPNGEANPRISAAGEQRLRIKFIKREKARFLSHLEISTALLRAINRSGLEFIYSRGFHPHPKVSFATATPVGMESLGEYAEMHVKKMHDLADNSLPNLLEKINRSLPAGIKVIAMEEIPSYGKTLFDLVKGFEYRMEIPDNIPDTAIAAIEDKIERFMKMEEFAITRNVKGKMVVKNIRPLVKSLSLDQQDRTIGIAVMLTGGGTVRPVDVLTEVIGLDGDAAKTFPVIKTDTYLVNS
jgi:radical SAM-linked protein